MTAQSIEYVELYTENRKPTIEHFVSSFGFTQTAESVATDRHSTMLCHGDVRLMVTSGEAVAAYLEEHGDGIADIAFGCDDVAATLDTARAAGARTLTAADGPPAVSGFGAVRHTLLPRSAPADRRLPAGPAWIPTPNPGPLPPWRRRIERLDHVAVCLEQGTLQDSVRRYTEGFGLSRYSSEQIEVGDQAMRSTVVRSATGLITFTILEPDPVKGSGQLDGFLARNRGAGVQHLAFLVDDIVLAVRDFEDRGVEFLRTPDAYYEMLADRLIDLRGQTEELRATNVLADRDEWGYLLQLFSRSPHERNTLFYELIQRRGAQGFGTANIKALYEAVDRARTAEEPVLHAQDGAAQ
ncbi:4-hydroxyphenylpyruvate dioxygenase [Catenulispora yoronensis]|uniref:4-hydroxyphenylpyruvate dioxygenase n=1 Tax=Catenulispora yoronensis TaxID=450799 RepID=A0ABP5H6D0_9ACTN